jgi:hypothetical protein
MGWSLFCVTIFIEVTLLVLHVLYDTLFFLGVTLFFETLPVSNKKSALSGRFFIVCRACVSSRWCKSTMGVSDYQPLAPGKGVHREVKSEGSRRAKSCPDEQEQHTRQGHSG